MSKAIQYLTEMLDPKEQQSKILKLHHSSHNFWKNASGEDFKWNERTKKFKQIRNKADLISKNSIQSSVSMDTEDLYDAIRKYKNVNVKYLEKRVLDADVQNLEEILDYITDGKYKQAGVLASNLDTAVREVIPPRIWKKMVGDNKPSTEKTSIKKLPEKIENFLLKFPDDAKKWNNATDEIKDMARAVRELASLSEDHALDFRAIKTPSEWNIKGKNYIRKIYNTLSDKNKEEFYKQFEHWFNKKQ